MSPDITQQSDRRREIIARATEAFVTNGYAGTSMAHLARAIGIQKASIYHHFPSKQDLFVACISDGFAGALERLEEMQNDPALTDRDKIIAAMEEIYRVNMTSTVGRMAPLIAEVAPRIPEVAQAFHKEFIARHYGLISRIIDDGIQRGSFAPVDPLVIRQMIIGPVIFMKMEREMMVSFADRDAFTPVDRIRNGHIAMILQLLRPTAD
jgi:AcrR family transcriptional regulator